MSEPNSAGYTPKYYASLDERTRRSAAEIVPIVIELVHPRDVVDVGCGIGVWLSVFQEFGVSDIWGVDGAWVDQAMLKIPAERFSAHDLGQALRLERKFDLAVSLEVAEHLSPHCAEPFVQSLTGLAPIVLFSAAIPFQGGADHQNEQWPEYWVDHFGRHGFTVIDCVRKRIWNNERVAWWYAQNTLIFARLDQLNRYPVLQREHELTSPWPLSVVHPRKYEKSMRGMGDLLVAWLDASKDDIARVVPENDTVILVDEGLFGPSIFGGRGTAALLAPGITEKIDDASLIRELGRLRELGSRFLAFGWPAFWWFQRHLEFHQYVRSSFRCILSNERLVVFDLQKGSVA
jgi:SAM-dependent methyltransferase